MARAVWVLLLLLPFLALPAVASDVIDATPETIQSLLTKDLLLELYAPWCGHCKSLAPTWEKVATTLKGELAVAKVDCTIHDALCERFEVQGFPTIVFASEGKMHKYAGMRSEEDLLGFARGGWKEAEGVAIGKAVEALPILHLNDSNADSVLFNHTRSLLLCFCASNLPICRYYKKHWLQVGDEFRDVLDIAVIDTSGSGAYHMEQRFNASESPALRYVHNQRVYTFDGEFTVAAIAAWLEEGFRNSSSYAVPAPPSQWDKFYRQYLYWPVQDGKTMLNRMPVATGVILAAGTLCGIVFSVVLGLFVQPKQKVN